MLVVCLVLSPSCHIYGVHGACGVLGAFTELPHGVLGAFTELPRGVHGASPSCQTHRTNRTHRTHKTKRIHMTHLRTLLEKELD